MYSIFIAVLPWVYIYPLDCIMRKFDRYCGYKNIGELYTAVLFSIIVIHHPHPTFYEYMIVISLFLPHYQLIFQVKSSFLTVSSWTVGSVLTCFMWDIWTTRIGGNSNFFYFQTIFCNLMAISFVVGILYLLVEKINKVIYK